MRRVVLGALALLALAAPAAAADLGGVWSIRDYREALRPEAGGDPPLTPAGKAAYDKNRAMAAKGDRSFDDVASACLPPGLPRLMLIDKPFEVIQKPKVVYFVHQENRLPRRVYLDEALPADPDPAFLGYSVGRWDGTTLTVRSSGFRAGTLLDDSGLPHSEALKLTETWRLADGGDTLEARFTIEDPQTFTRPWTAVAHYRKRPGLLIPEEVCAERLKTTAPRGRGR